MSVNVGGTSIAPVVVAQEMARRARFSTSAETPACSATVISTSPAANDGGSTVRVTDSSAAGRTSGICASAERNDGTASRHKLIATSARTNRLFTLFISVVYVGTLSV